MRSFASLLVLAAIAVPLAAPSVAWAGDTPAPKSAKAFFVNLKNGEKVTNPVKVVMGVKDMEIVPAGTEKPNAGHFHILVDTKLSPEERKVAIAKDDQHIHYGKGQTEAELTLTPGKHTLQIVLGDAKHELHIHPVMSKIITVIVQ